MEGEAEFRAAVLLQNVAWAALGTMGHRMV